MSDGRPYPPDEFDVDVVGDGPRGVHRAPRSALRRWAPFLVVLVVFPALAFGVVTWLSSWEGRPDVDLPVFGDEQPTTAATAAPRTATEDPGADASPTPTPTPDPPPEPDLDRAVTVYNATQIAGLAGSAATELEGAGFTDVSPDNWGFADPPATVVYYPSAEDEGTAAAVAQALGIEAVELSERAGASVAVVLVDDYRS